MAEIGFERFETLAYWWKTTPRVWFVLVDEVDILSRHLEEEGKKPYEPSGPFMTSTETRSLRMGIAASDANYNISSVISAPHIKCIAAATSFIKGYQDIFICGEKRMNIKIEAGLGKTATAFQLHKQFQLLAVESGYNVDETYKSFKKYPVNYGISTSVVSKWRITSTVKSIRKKFPVSRGNTVAVFVDSSLKSILKRLGLKETRPMDPRTASPRAIAENKQEDEN
ncbi:Ubiquitin-associated and SH3 domain-containing protein [Trichinella spiralis]|uniref:Ubiquitin-associated and SH3 domain-containing protein n=1 Tax=Trichinella spiralis TaxID=6334 RepID=A0ABR3KWR8_TRISP